MDRWSGRDEADDSGCRSQAAPGPSGRVALLGMGAFVRSSTSAGSTDSAVLSKAQVVPSRQEQKVRAAAADAAELPLPVPPSASGFKAPPWAGQPPAGLALEVLKPGSASQIIPLERPATVFGRLATADIMLEHPSISRSHAAVCFNSRTGKFMVLDLQSAHGTLVNGHRVNKDTPAELREGDEVRFGASTRRYLLRMRQRNEAQKRNARDGSLSDGSGPERKRSKGVRFAGDAAGSSKKLDEVIGYSDGGDFAVNVGPVPVGDGAEGRFQNLIKPFSGKAKVSHEPGGAPAAGSTVTHTAEPADGHHPQEAFRKFVEERQQRHSSIYDLLPPPGH